MTSQRPLRIAVLECDTPQPQTRARFGSYTGLFTALLQQASSSSSSSTSSTDLHITGHDVVNNLYSYPSLDEVDALLLTGSRHTAYDNDPWILKLVDFTKRALAANCRIVGVCFGHQILGRAVGTGVGKCEKGWEVAVTDVSLTEKGKELFGLDVMVSRRFPPSQPPQPSFPMPGSNPMFSKASKRRIMEKYKQFGRMKSIKKGSRCHWKYKSCRT